MLSREGVYECDAHVRTFDRCSSLGRCGMSCRVLLYIYRHNTHPMSSRNILSSWRGAANGVFYRVVLSCWIIITDTMSFRKLLPDTEYQDAMHTWHVFILNECDFSLYLSCVSGGQVLSERFGIGDDVSSWKFLSAWIRCVGYMCSGILLSDDTGTDYMPGGRDVSSWDVVELRHRM